MKYCIECKNNVVSHYRSYFCEDCIKDFFEDKESEEEDYESNRKNKTMGNR